jgi:hypothetical protein
VNKVIYVKAHFKPIMKEKTVKVPTGEKKKGLFGGEKDITKKEKQLVKTGVSDCEIDGERLALEIQNAIETLNIEGYEVIGITQITSGRYKYETKRDKDYSSSLESSYGWGWGWGYGYGYSFTEGVTIVAKKLT